MFDPDSRYAGLPTATTTTADGREVVFVTRRFVPRASALPAIGIAVVTEGERLDQIAARTLGDPGRYWLVCDANDAMHPRDLVARPGAHLRIATGP